MIDTAPKRAIEVIAEAVAAEELDVAMREARRVVAYLHAAGLQIVDARELAAFDAWRREQQQELPGVRGG